MAENVKVNVSQCKVVSCATGSAIKTQDGFTHQMGRVVPLPVLDEAKKDDAKAAFTVLQHYLAMCQAINAEGAKVDLVSVDGKVAATINPTDSIPSGSEREETKDKEGKVESVTIKHGQNMPQSSLPQNWADIISMLADGGVAGNVRAKGTAEITQEFKQGGGTRGRQAAQVDVSKFA